MKFLNILLAIIIAFAITLNVFAQEPGEEKGNVSNYSRFDYIETLTPEYYTVLLDSIKNNQSQDYFSLRMAYTKTSNYNPSNLESSDSLLKAMELTEAGKYDEALVILENIRQQNYPHIESHLYSGYIYKVLGDSIKSKYHYRVFNGLLKSIYESGDGSSPETAFIVINTTEEYNLLDWFKLNFVEQSLERSVKFMFDLMTVTEKGTEQKLEIYFNVTLPFRTLKKN